MTNGPEAAAQSKRPVRRNVLTARAVAEWKRMPVCEAGTVRWVVAPARWVAATLTGPSLGLGTQIRPHIERRFGASFDDPVGRLSDHIGAVRDEALAPGG